MTQPVDSSLSQDPVWKGVGPFRNVQVGGHDGALALVALGDDIMKVFVLGGLERLEAEVVDDQKIDAGDFCEVSVIAVDRPGGVELDQHLEGHRDVRSISLFGRNSPDSYYRKWQNIL